MESRSQSQYPANSNRSYQYQASLNTPSDSPIVTMIVLLQLQRRKIESRACTYRFYYAHPPSSCLLCPIFKDINATERFGLRGKRAPTTILGTVTPNDEKRGGSQETRNTYLILS